METETSRLLALWLTPNGVAASGIWAGIVVMTLVNVVRGRADKRRADAEQRRHDAAMAAQADSHKEAMAAQAESRRALEVLIASLERQGASLEASTAALAASLERQGASLERQGAALEEILRRTAPRPGPAE